MMFFFVNTDTQLLISQFRQYIAPIYYIEIPIPAVCPSDNESE